MNPLDRKLSAIFRTLAKSPHGTVMRERASSDFRQVRPRVGESGPGTLFDELFRDVSAAPEAQRKLVTPEADEIVRDLRDRGFVETATWLFGWWQGSFSEMQL